MSTLNIINYLLYTILLLIIVIQVTYFFIKITVKERIAIINSPSIRYVILSLGIFMLILGLFNLLIFIKRGNQDIFIQIAPLILGFSQIASFMNSNIYIVKKGIYISTIPFFIPKSNIKTCKVENNFLILKSNNSEKEYKIQFKNNEIEKMKNAITDFFK